MLIPQPSYRVFSGLPPKTHWAPAGVSRRGPRGFWLPSGGEPSAQQTGGSGVGLPRSRTRRVVRPRRRGWPGMVPGVGLMGMRGGPGARAGSGRGRFRIWGKPLGACAPRGFLYVWCGGVLLSHTLSGAVPSPCQALASGFGMGPGVSPGPWPPQIFSYTVRRWGLPACGGLGTGQRTRICRCFVLWPDNAHCRLVPFAGGRCGPTARGWNVGVAFRPLVPVGSTPRGASTSGLSTTCSAWGLQELEGSTECLSWSRLPA